MKEREKNIRIFVLIIIPALVSIAMYIVTENTDPFSSHRPFHIFLHIALILIIWVLFVIYFLWFLKDKESEYMKRMVHVLKRREEIAQKEMVMAKKVQEGLLSMSRPEIDGINISSKCIPAENIGGDFFAFISKKVGYISHKDTSPGIIQYRDKMDDYLGIVIGDVAGHGVSSALVMTLANGLLGEIGKNVYSPAKVLGEANIDLRNYIVNSDISFVTAFYGLLNLVTGQLIYSRAGHVNPVIIKPSGEYQILENDGVFLGMFVDEVYKDNKITLEEKDKIILFTDGITETRNKEGEFYGIDRLINLLISSRNLPVSDIQAEIFRDVESFSGGKPQDDDRTVVIVEIDKKLNFQ